jgi:tetratricopeptide (TPR) repeat protein
VTHPISGKSLSGGLRRSLALIALGAGLTLGLAAEESNNTWSDNVAEKLPQLDTFQKDKKYPEAIAMLDSLIKSSTPGSYDEVMLLQFKAKFFMMDNKLHEAIQPFERSLAIGGKVLRAEDTQWTRFYLAQIYYQDGTAKGLSVQQQKAAFKKAAAYMKEWHDNNVGGRVNSDASIFYANVLYNLAQINSEVQDKVDPEYLAQARQAIEKAMSEIAKPKDNIYLLMVATLQQQQQYALASDYLEALVNVQPTNKNAWQQLFATYCQLSGDTKDPEAAFNYNVRAIITMDRAQKLGFLNSQKDNFNRVGIYFNIQQHAKAAELLHAGLKDGSIEDNLKNWELLAYSYQQVKHEDLAIKALKEALSRYPDKGQLWFSIAQNYYNSEQIKPAYDASMKAIQVGNLEHPDKVYSFAAYMAFELRMFDEALTVATKALEYPESKKDTQLARLKTAIEDSIKEREMNRKAIETQHKLR